MRGEREERAIERKRGETGGGECVGWEVCEKGQTKREGCVERATNRAGSECQIYSWSEINCKPGESCLVNRLKPCRLKESRSKQGQSLLHTDQDSERGAWLTPPRASNVAGGRGNGCSRRRL